MSNQMGQHPSDLPPVTPAQQPEQTVAPNLTLRFELSPTIGTLFGALAKAQKAFKPVKKTSKNPFYKSSYADLAEVIDATRDALSDNGLAIIQPPCFRRVDGTVEVHTFMGHSSGEWMHSVLDMPPTAKTDAQAVGSSITYGRRYSYSGTVCVASEDDDDGNAAVSKPFRGRQEESPEDFDQRTVDQQNIGPVQIKQIDDALKSTGKTEDEIKAALEFVGEKRIEHIKKPKFEKFLKWAGSTVKMPKGPPVAEQQRMLAMKRLWAVASEFSIPEVDVKTASYEKFAVDSMTKLNAGQLDEMTAWVRSVAEAIKQS